MIKNLKYVLLGIILGSLIVFLMYSKSADTSKQEDADAVIDRIEAVKKIVVTEGYFTEL